MDNCLLPSASKRRVKSQSFVINPLLYERGKFSHTHTHKQYSVTDRVLQFIFEHTFLYKVTLCVDRSDVSTYVFVCCILPQPAQKKQQNEGCGGQQGANILQMWHKFEKTHAFHLKNKTKYRSHFFYSSHIMHASWSNVTDMEMPQASQLLCSSGSSQWAPGPLVASHLERNWAKRLNVQTRFQADLSWN